MVDCPLEIVILLRVRARNETTAETIKASYRFLVIQRKLLAQWLELLEPLIDQRKHEFADCQILHAVIDCQDGPDDATATQG